MKETIVVAGSLAQKPGHGGHTWVFLNYLLGFKRLGWDVLFLDRLEKPLDEVVQRITPSGSFQLVPSMPRTNGYTEHSA